MEQLIFATDAEIDGSLRFQVLQMRRDKVAEFRNFRPVPTSDKEMPKDIVLAREKRSPT